MNFIRLYMRVLTLLGSEARLGWILAVANLALAGAMFAEPILFGRIIDTLANSQSRAAELDWHRLVLLLGAWVGFALFTIVSGTLISLHADRLSHRQYQVVRTMFFEHVLQLPLSYHGGAHSGRLVKVMVTGTNTLWSLWLAFFREHFVAFISLLVLLPATLFLNWRYGVLLIALCCVFATLIAFIISRSEKNPTLVLDVASALGASGLAPHRLELEITETVMLNDTEMTIRTLRNLKELGVRIAMDDFGAGYSSLSYLRKFPFDKLKIDQSFIQSLGHEHESAAIVKAIIGLGSSLAMRITAEGVETLDQLNRLVGEGCGEAQGYYFSRPVEAAEVLSVCQDIARSMGAKSIFRQSA